jgi:hypothetical protein
LIGQPIPIPASAIAALDSSALAAIVKKIIVIIEILVKIPQLFQRKSAKSNGD